MKFIHLFITGQQTKSIDSHGQLKSFQFLFPNPLLLGAPTPEQFATVYTVADKVEDSKNFLKNYRKLRQEIGATWQSTRAQRGPANDMDEEKL